MRKEEGSTEAGVLTMTTAAVNGCLRGVMLACLQNRAPFQSVANKHHEVIIPLLAYDPSTPSILSKIALGCLGYTIVDDHAMRSSVVIISHVLLFGHYTISHLGNAIRTSQTNANCFGR